MMKCPYCSKEFDPREAQAEAEWREIIALLPAFGPHSRLAFEYCEKFGVTPLRIRTKKLLRLLGEVAALFRGERFAYNRKEYRISGAGIAEALKTVCNKHFDRPLENHNYLKKVMISISEREARERSIRQERELRKREELLRGGIRPACRPQSGRPDCGRQAGGEEGGISAEEYKRRAGIRSLAEMVRGME